MEKIKKIDWKDIGVRALKTFIQTFLAGISIDGIFDISDSEGFKRYALTTGVSALAAAISAVWNLIMSLISDYVSEKIDHGKDDSTDAYNEIEELELIDDDQIEVDEIVL